MSPYRIYFVGAEGQYLGPATVVECADEQEAIGKAAHQAKGCAVELWIDARLIARFPKDDPIAPPWAQTVHVAQGMV
jgi:hypothetical protein